MKIRRTTATAEGKRLTQRPEFVRPYAGMRPVLQAELGRSRRYAAVLLGLCLIEASGREWQRIRPPWCGSTGQVQLEFHPRAEGPHS